MRKFNLASLVLTMALFAFGGSAIRAQMTLPAKLRGPAIAGPIKAQLERGQNSYVMNNCHLCHGPTLAEARGGGADLANSLIVKMDFGGDMIGPVVKAGLPFTQTAMPQYPGMTDSELADLVAYIHYMRQQLHEKNALAIPVTAPASVASGQAFFFQNCASCHNGAKDLSKVVSKSDNRALSALIIRPGVAQPSAAIDAPGRQVHLALLEGYLPADVANLTAYLRQSGGVLSAAFAKAMIPPRREISARFAEQCAMCHGPNGSGGDRAPGLVNNADLKELDVDSIKSLIATGLPGGMPAFHLSDEELNDYAVWLKARSRAR